MDRDHLNNLTYAQLKNEVIKIGRIPLGSKARCLDLLMDHYERNAHQDLLELADKDGPPLLGLSTDNEQSGPGSAASPSTSAAPATTEVAIQKSLEAIAENMRLQHEQLKLQREQMKQHQDQMMQQQEMLAQLINLNKYNISRNQPPTVPSAVLPNNPSASSDNQIPGTSYQGQGQIQSGFSLTHSDSVASAPSVAVKLLASQVPEFGTEEEDIELWIQRIEQVSCIHGVTQNITLLAATNKLVKTARRWFDLCPVSVYESWLTFKTAIVSRFERTVLFHVAIQKVETRKWNAHKESFQDSAMDKLALMQKLRLSDREAIHYLIHGISSLAIRSTVAALRSISVDHFLKEMHHVIVSCGDSLKRSSSEPNGKEKPKGSTSSPSNKGNTRDCPLRFRRLFDML